MANDKAPIARLVNVHKTFGRLKVLQGVSLDFAHGQVSVVIGPSGTGKSVLLKHLVGLIRPDLGEVYFEGQRVDRLDAGELVAARRRIGFLFQMGALFDSMTVGQNIAFPLKEHAGMTRQQRQSRVADVLKLVGLPGIETKMPCELSGGQRKRVALARAIVLEPDLVLYDEPTTGLDPIRSDLINELIVTLNDRLGISSIVVTHDMASVRKIADRVIMLDGGQIIADDSPDILEQSADPRVQRFVRGQSAPEELQSIRQAFDEPASHLPKG